MNPTWNAFLQANFAATVTETDITFPTIAEPSQSPWYALKHLAVLSVTGSQAAKFLQGQITCNVDDVSEQQASFGAICSAQGKVISTFVLVKTTSGYWLILPTELLATVKTRLQKYVLRADVQLLDSSADYCLIGEASPPAADTLWFACTNQADGIRINFGDRQLLVLATDLAISIATERQQQGHTFGNSQVWRYSDMLAGIAWLSLLTSEQFIPQMLDVDKRGGISLTKGCYTGQEIVARTHYLGKAKRALFLLAAEPPVAVEENAAIADDSGQVIGRVVNTVVQQTATILLCVLPIEAEKSQLNLPEYPNHTLTVNNAHG